MNHSSAALLVGLLLSGLLTLGRGVLAERGAEAPLPLEGLRAFTEIFDRIKSDYVEPVADGTLLENAIRGMVAALDPHSAYLTAEELKELKAESTGEFGGLGMEIDGANGLIKVTTLIDDTPAARAEVKTGDVIIRLDGQLVTGITVSEAVKRMRGEPGTDITLTILREDANETLELTLTRAVIKVPSVKGRVLEEGYGYLRISRFQSRTGKELRDAVSKLEAQNGGELEGMILDLRNNPGGVLEVAAGAADAFLEAGIIVYTEGRMESSGMKFRATPTDILEGAPLVVLVNGRTASAAEVVAGALKDHQRAVIMGSRTFGKGSVQSILPMGNGSALKLTTARYFTPSGISIQAGGILPDVVLDKVEPAGRARAAKGDTKDSGLPGHLENDTAQETRNGSIDDSSSTKAGAAEELPLAETDFALFEALNLLKARSILRKVEP